MARRGYEQPNFDNTSEENLFSAQPIMHLEPDLHQLAEPVSEGEIVITRPDPDPSIAQAEVDRIFDLKDRQAQFTDPQIRDAAGIESPEDIERKDNKGSAKRAAKAKKPSKPSPARNPGIRRLPAYDKDIPPEARLGGERLNEAEKEAGRRAVERAKRQIFGGDKAA